MKKVIMHRTGGPEVLEVIDCPTPSPGAGEVLVRAEAIGVGWPDVLIRNGSYRWMPPLPTSPGSDLAGHIEAVGADVDATLIGKPVLVTARELAVRGGCYAERMVAPAAAVFLLPEGTDPDSAVCLPNYQVAWNLVHVVARGRPVRSLFVNGVAGAVGSAAAQLGLAAGMTVIGSVGSDEKATFANRLGVHHVVRYRDKDVVERVLQLTGGRGVDLALDHVGGPGFAGLLRMLADWGTLVSYNAIGGLPEENLLGALRAQGARCPAIRIFEMHIYDKDRTTRRRIMTNVIDCLHKGTITPVISARLPLTAAARAHEMVERGTGMGKIVLKPALDGLA